jgi:Flp pilus assembly protein TadG
MNAIRNSQFRIQNSESGQAIAEVMIVLLILLPVLFGAIEFGQGVSLKHSLDTGTSLAVRRLSINPAETTAAEALIQQTVDSNVLGGGVAVTVRYYDEWGEIPPAAMASLPFGSRFSVAASVPFQASVPLMSLGGRTITVRHYGMVERWP